VSRLLANLTLAQDVLVLATRRRLTWLYMALSAVIVCALVLGADLVEVQDAEATLWRLDFFGQELLAPKKGLPEVVRPALLLALYRIGFVTLGGMSLIGLALGLLATMTSVSNAFEPGRAELTLPRPVSRAEIVISRFCGALAFGAIQALWISLLAFALAGVKFGLWRPKLLLLGPALLLKFAVVLAVCTCVVVWLRSRALGLAASAFVWLGSYLINSLSLRISAAKAEGDAALLGLAEPVGWAQRLFPQIPHQEFLAVWLCEQSLEVPAFDERLVVLQGVTWVALLLSLTVWVVSGRDY
jgi:hypothetical protein